LNTVLLNNRPITPSKIVCIGRNYVEHIKELGNELPTEMVVFFKPNSAISTKLSAFHQEPLHYEGELCFLYQQGKFTAIGFGLDLTKRGLQTKLKDKALPWERAKAFNGSALFSEFISIQSNNEELMEKFSLELLINDKIVQAGDVTKMMVRPDKILVDLQQFVTLEDGDIVMTGTPKGVGLVNAEDVFVGKVLLSGIEITRATWLAQ